MNPSYCLIKSSDRTTGNSNQFQIDLLVPIQGVKKVSLAQATIPNTIYNIQTNVNDRFNFFRGSSFSYQIPAGAYTINNLLSTIQTGINGLDANSYSLTYNTTTMKVTITGTGAFSLNWASNANASTGCYSVLGWTKADTSSSTSITAPNVPALQNPTNILMIISELGTDKYTTTNANKYTFIVPNTVDSGEIIEYFPNDENYQVIAFGTPMNFTKFTVSLFDDTNSLINLNGSEWNMSLQFEY